MAASSVPLIALRGTHPIWIPLAAMLVVQAAVFGIHAFNTQRELVDCGKLETFVPVHMVLCIMYLLLPALYDARDAYYRPKNAREATTSFPGSSGVRPLPHD
jgi:hypothetical protein